MSTWLYLFKNKSEVCDVFRLFRQMIKTQYSSDIKVLRSNNGGEYINSELFKFLQDRGIVHETTCPCTYPTIKWSDGKKESSYSGDSLCFAD